MNLQIIIKNTNTAIISALFILLTDVSLLNINFNILYYLQNVLYYIISIQINTYLFHKL